jgi:hypothetical protein
VGPFGNEAGDTVSDEPVFVGDDPRRQFKSRIAGGTDDDDLVGRKWRSGIAARKSRALHGRHGGAGFHRGAQPTDLRAEPVAVAPGDDRGDEHVRPQDFAHERRECPEPDRDIADVAAVDDLPQSEPAHDRVDPPERSDIEAVEPAERQADDQADASGACRGGVQVTEHRAG